MIVVKLIGGLGNQMFQYALGRSLADAHHCPLKLDISGFADYTLRRYELGDLNIRAEIASAQEIAAFHMPGQDNRYIARLRRLLGWMPSHRYMEKSFSFNEEVLDLSPPVYLDGYWQSEKYFTSIAKPLREDFSLLEGADEANQEMLERITQVNAVSLHVRRGDYVTNPHTASYHGLCSLDYYREAVAHIAAKVADPHFFVFSDDPEWVAENLRLDHPMTHVDINTPDKGVWDMMLMKACRHHVIANSSFSWWGAWLNSAEGKVVVAPRRWFNDASVNTNDLLPENWVRL